MSDKTLDQLIASLKTEAIDAAEKESETILENAKQQAQQIVRAAEEKSAAILAEAEQNAEAIQKKGTSALQQAGRDYSISMRNELLQMLQAVFEQEVRSEFTPDLLKTAIMKVIENIGSKVDLKLPKEFSKELSDYVHTQLQSPEKVVSIQEENSFLNGFSITHSEEGWSYTISPEDVAAALQNHLNNNWVNIFKNEQ